MVNALNECVQSSLKKYYFNTNCNCSLKTFHEAENNPFIILCRLFHFDEGELVKYLDEIDRSYYIIYKETALLKTKMKFVPKVRKHLPFWIRICTFNDLYKYIGIEPITTRITRPSIKFIYCNPTGCCQTYNIVFDTQTIRNLKTFATKYQEHNSVNQH